MLDWPITPKYDGHLPDTEITYNPYKSGNFYYVQAPENRYTGSDFADLLVRDGKAKVFAYNIGA
jgi:hypothetical protein